MLLPLRDKNPLKVIPFQLVTFTLIAICVGVFLWQISLPAKAENAFSLSYGLIPAVLFDLSALDPALVRLPAEATVVTSLFLHGGWMHLIGNMLFLWVFGDNVEDAMGHTRFAVFYLLCGIAASLAHALSVPGSTSPLVGASGAIAGVLGAYIMLHPKVKVLLLAFTSIPLYLPAYIVLGVWIATQIFYAFAASGEPVAWWAHIGGVAAGMLLAVPFKRREVPLFGGR